MLMLSYLLIVHDALIVIHHVERLIDPGDALEVDTAIKQPRAVKTAAEHRPIQPVLTVV